MTFVSWQDLEADAGDLVQSGLQAIAAAGRTVICAVSDVGSALWRGDPTGLGRQADGSLQNTCHQPPQFPPGAKGVCNIVYSCRIKVENAFSPGDEPNAVYNFNVGSYGSPSFSPGTNGVDYTVVDASGNQAAGYSSYGSFITWRPEYGGVAIISATRDPDCPSPTYTPPAPALPPQTTPTADQLNVIVPVQITPSLIIPVNFVYVRPEIDVNITAPVKIDLRPTLQLPDLNLQLQFDFHGVEINNYGGGNSTQPSLPPDPRTNPPAPAAPNPADTCDLTDVKRKLDDLADCHRCDVTYDYATAQASGNSFALSAPSGKEAVRVVVNATHYPANVKNQYGGGNVQDVLYLGWFAFTVNGNPGIRTPINYALSTYQIPSGCDGVAVTGYGGVQFTATLTYRSVHAT